MTSTAGEHRIWWLSNCRGRLGQRPFDVALIGSQRLAKIEVEGTGRISDLVPVDVPTPDRTQDRYPAGS